MPMNLICCLVMVERRFSLPSDCCLPGKRVAGFWHMLCFSHDVNWLSYDIDVSIHVSKTAAEKYEHSKKQGRSIEVILIFSGAFIDPI